MARIFLILLLLTSLCPAAKASRHQHGQRPVELPHIELRELSAAIKAAPTYQRQRQKEIDSIAARLNGEKNPRRLWNTYLLLSEQYTLFNTDSALKYAQLGYELTDQLDEVCRQMSLIQFVKALSTAGIFTQAMDIYNRLHDVPMSIDTRVEYWQAGRMLYSYMRTYVDGQELFYDLYTRQYFEIDDSLVRHLPADSRLREFIICERLVNEGQFRPAKKRLEELLGQSHPNERIYGMAAFQLAEVYRNQNDETHYATLLARSAISDIRGAIKEGVALPALANWLYEQGNLNDAFSFINFALEDAMSGNARMRAVTIAQLVPLIDEAYREKINASRDEMMIYLLLVTFLLIISGVLLFVLVRQIKRRNATAKKLAATSKLQESYIGNFIGLYSSYADRLDRLTKLVSLKLSTGQTAELRKMIESGKFADENNDDIHKIFDSAFLDIYPDFVTQINRLLREEEAITLKNPSQLTPELRIYAFVRLGLDESARIAQILRYSSNTVYAYRNRMRNRAINRDTFDDDVMKIGVDDE